jgi:hypothetical protein
MIVEIALGIVLAVIILAFLGEIIAAILALGAIAILIGVVVVVLIVGAVVVKEHPDVAVMVVGFAAIIGGIAGLMTLYERLTKKRKESPEHLTAVSATLGGPVEPTKTFPTPEASMKADRIAQRSITFFFLALTTLAIFPDIYARIIGLAPLIQAEWWALVAIWLVFLGLFLRAAFKRIDEPYFRLPKQKR